MRNEVKAAAEKAVAAVQELLKLSNGFDFSWTNLYLDPENNGFKVQVMYSDLRKISNDITIKSYGDVYKAAAKIGGIEFFAIVKELELPKAETNVA